MRIIDKRSGQDIADGEVTDILSSPCKIGGCEYSSTGWIFIILDTGYAIELDEDVTDNIIKIKLKNYLT